MATLTPKSTNPVGNEGSSPAAMGEQIDQQPASVETLAENGTSTQGRGISFSGGPDDTKTGLFSKSSVFDRLGHESSRGTLDEKKLSQQETRPVPRHYFLQRPRALQYTYRGERIGYGEDAAPIEHVVSGASDVKYTAEGVAKARERIDLFIDLVWVGIISNLSEVYSGVFFSIDAQSGKAFLMFILVFLPAWRIWNFLREFLNSFYMDDTVQRLFIFWILALSVFFGNQIAYFAEDYERVKRTLIFTYIIIRGSFIYMEILYSLWIPWIRRLIFVNFLIALPASGMWLGAIWAQGANAVGPALAAIIWEYIVPGVLDTPVGDKLIPSNYRKEVDPIHVRGRMGNFLIITVGEGVLMLIRGGPLGLGLTTAASFAVWALLIYFLLAYFYFFRDGSVRYIPAVRHKGFKLMFWITFHIPLFASFITLSSGVLWLINRAANVPINDVALADLTDDEFLILRKRALWDIGVNISTILTSYTAIALLDRPLDPPGTTLVHSRYVRLLGRPVYIAVILGVASVQDMNGLLYLGICGIGLSLLTLYELVLSLELPSRFIEPKGLTVLMRHEYRQDSSQRLQGSQSIRIPI